MNKITSILLALLFFLTCEHRGTSTMYVTASGGLALRRSPNVNGQVIRMIPNGAEVKFEKFIGQRVIIDDCRGRWAKVSFITEEGYVFGCFLSSLPNSSEKESAQGQISGLSRYPSEGNPPELTTCAENLRTHRVVCINTSRKAEYSLTVPAGDYRIFSYLKDTAHDRPAYFTEFVSCGFKVTCLSHKIIVIHIRAGEIKSNIDPMDWYTTEDWSAQEDQYP